MAGSHPSRCWVICLCHGFVSVLCLAGGAPGGVYMRSDLEAGQRQGLVRSEVLVASSGRITGQGAKPAGHHHRAADHAHGTEHSSADKHHKAQHVPSTLEQVNSKRAGDNELIKKKQGSPDSDFSFEIDDDPQDDGTRDDPLEDQVNGRGDFATSPHSGDNVDSNGDLPAEDVSDGDGGIARKPQDEEDQDGGIARKPQDDDNDVSADGLPRQSHRPVIFRATNTGDAGNPPVNVSNINEAIGTGSNGTMNTSSNGSNATLAPSTQQAAQQQEEAAAGERLRIAATKQKVKEEAEAEQERIAAAAAAAAAAQRRRQSLPPPPPARPAKPPVSEQHTMRTVSHVDSSNSKESGSSYSAHNSTASNASAVTDRGTVVPAILKAQQSASSSR